jgi:hypothetical protein
MSCLRVGLYQQAEPEVVYQDTDEETKGTSEISFNDGGTTMQRRGEQK